MNKTYHALVGLLFAASAACVVLGAAEYCRRDGLPALAAAYAAACAHFFLSVRCSFPEEA